MAERKKRAKKSRKKGTLFGRPRGDVVKHPGAFGKEAAKHGESTGAYAKSVLKPGSKASTKTKRRAALAKAFQTMRARKGHKRHNSRTRKG